MNRNISMHQVCVRLLTIFILFFLLALFKFLIFVVLFFHRVFLSLEAKLGFRLGKGAFIYLGFAQLICFDKRLISQEISLAEHEYTNIHDKLVIICTKTGEIFI